MTTEPTILGGQAAIDLWLQGRRAWNQWVDQHPKAYINFSGVDFSRYRGCDNIPQNLWPFAGFRFPNGDVCFWEAKFGKGKVNFSGAQFGEGDVIFFGAQFGEGYISFRDTQFGYGNINFSEVQFGEGDVSFSGATFKGPVFFVDTVLGDGQYYFHHTDFSDSVIFNRLENAGAVQGFSFQFASFNGSLQFSALERFNCVIDLIGTKITHHISLAGLRCKMQTERPLKLIGCIARLGGGRLLRRYGWIPLSKFLKWLTKDAKWLNKTTAVDKDDAERFRRLKELAENNKDHSQALHFKAQEMQAARWHTSTGWDLVMEFLYQKFSNYGRSEWRPILGLAFFWVFFATIYAYCSNTLHSFWEKLAAALIFSAGQMLPYIPSARDARELPTIFFHCGQLPGWAYAGTFLQNLLAVALFFLVGLALRNRFRL